MRSRFLVACLLLLSACKVTTPAVVTTKASASPTVKPAAAEPSPSSHPTAVPSIQAQASVALDGSIQLDASYIVASGAGNIVASGAGNIVATGAGNAIAAKLDLAALGNQLIGNDGASAVGAAGNQLIGNDGAGIISNDGASRHLLAADTTAGMLPAASMAVQAIDLATSQPILMVDGKGHVGKWILSDGSGRFKLYVPQKLATNIEVRAQAPAALGDPRLRLSCLIDPTDQGEAGVDEVTTVALDFCRYALAARMDSLILADQGAPIKDNNLTPGELALLDGLRDQVKASLTAAGISTFSGQERRALSMRLANYLLAFLQLRVVKVDKATTPEFTGSADLLALPAMDQVLRKLQGLAAAKLKADPGFLANQAFLTRYNTFAPTIQRKAFEIKTAADVGDFVAEAYIGGNDYVGQYTDDSNILAATGRVLAAVGDDQADDDASKLQAGVNGVSRVVILALGSRLEQVEAIIASMQDPKVRATLADIDTNGR